MKCNLHQQVEDEQRKIGEIVIVLSTKFDNMISRITEFIEKTETIIDKLKEGHDTLNSRLTDKIEILKKEMVHEIKSGDDKLWNRLNEFTIHFDTYKLEEMKKRNEERIQYDEKLDKMDKRLYKIIYTFGGIMIAITILGQALSIIKFIK